MNQLIGIETIKLAKKAHKWLSGVSFHNSVETVGDDVETAARALQRIDRAFFEYRAGRITQECIETLREAASIGEMVADFIA